MSAAGTMLPVPGHLAPLDPCRQSSPHGTELCLLPSRDPVVCHREDPQRRVECGQAPGPAGTWPPSLETRRGSAPRRAGGCQVTGLGGQELLGAPTLHHHLPLRALHPSRPAIHSAHPPGCSSHPPAAYRCRDLLPSNTWALCILSCKFPCDTRCTSPGRVLPQEAVNTA